MTITIYTALGEIDFSLAKFGQTSVYDIYTAEREFLSKARFWHSSSGVPQALWAGFAVPVPMVKFSFQTNPDSIRDGPTKYDFFGSNSADCSDQSSWKTLFEDNSGTSFTHGSTPKTQVVSGNESFSCYGFNVKAVHGRSDGKKYVIMSNIKLYTTGNTRTLL